MLSDKVFQIAFLVSLVTHGIILFQNPNAGFLPIQKDQQDLEVSYLKPLQKPEITSKIQVPKKEREPLHRTLSSKMTTRRISPPPYADKENILKIVKDSVSKERGFIKPAFIKSDIISVKKIITLPPLDMDKINNPSYISYYQIVREKIRRAAYQNYGRAEVGEVYLYFTVSKDGFFKEIRTVEEKSSPNPYLREVALKSIKDASPFPAFPKELDYPQLSFNIVISFEIE